MPIINVEGLEKTYPGPVKAVCGIDLSVEEGNIFSLLGPNGAGKSTTVRMLTTLTAPTAGKAEVAGFDIRGGSPHIRRSIGYVAQGSCADAQLSGVENLLLQGRLFGLKGADLGSRIASLLDLFQLEDAADRLVRTYSGGMRRRIDIAMGLIHSPKILFLDEPSSGLDPESRSIMWKKVERLARDQGITVFLTTHYLEEADRLADRIAIIDEGRIIAQGSPEALKAGLKGDQISLSFASAETAMKACELLKTKAVIKDMSVSETRIQASVEDGARAIPEIMQMLSDVEVTHITMNRPSLDDVYLSVTGKQYKIKDDTSDSPAQPKKRRAA